jgi:hypothetical protein
MVIKYTNIFHCKTFQNLPKLGFLVWKCTIWQPCFQSLRAVLLMRWAGFQTDNDDSPLGQLYRDQCYDHNFFAIFANVQPKNRRFSQKPLLWSKFWNKLAVICTKKSKNFCENISKIITSFNGNNFRRFSPIFGEKIVVFLKNNVMIKF